MSSDRPSRGIRLLAAGLALLLMAASTAACDRLPGNAPAEGPQQATPVADHGPCLPTIGSEVKAGSITADGQRLVYLSGERPDDLADGESWSADDAAVHVLDAGTDGGFTSYTTRVIVKPWPGSEDDVIPVYPTDVPGDANPPDATVLYEKLAHLALAPSGGRFVVGVLRDGVTGGLAKLYAGIVPEGDQLLKPGEGLTLVGINDYKGTEGVRTVTLSPDGSRMAAVVGMQGEVRVYDFGADKLYVYNTGKDGNVEVSNELPKAETTITQGRVPAIAHTGILRLEWAPDNKRLAISRYEGVGVAGVWILDTTTGQAELVRTFTNTTVPHVVWSSDGQSLFALTTNLFQGDVLGDSEVRRVRATQDGKDIGDRWQLKQVPGYKTAPADFTGYGDDQNFVFTWEDQLWLLEIPASGSGAASYGPVTLNPPTMRVASGNVSVAPAADRAAFMVRDSAGTHMGLRMSAKEETCAAEAGTPAATEPETGGGTAESAQPPTAAPGATESETAQPAPSAAATNEATSEPATATQGG